MLLQKQQILEHTTSLIEKKLLKSFEFLRMSYKNGCLDICDSESLMAASATRLAFS